MTDSSQTRPMTADDVRDAFHYLMQVRKKLQSLPQAYFETHDEFWSCLMELSALVRPGPEDDEPTGYRLTVLDHIIRCAVEENQRLQSSLAFDFGDDRADLALDTLSALLKRKFR